MPPMNAVQQFVAQKYGLQQGQAAPDPTYAGPMAAPPQDAAPQQQDPSAQPDAGAQPQGAQPAIPPNYSLAEAYMHLKLRGEVDMDAAIKAAAHVRSQAGNMSELRRASNLLTKQPDDSLEYQKNLEQQADQPIRDVMNKNAQREEMLKQALGEGALQMKSAQDQNALAMLNPAHPANQALQHAVTSSGMAQRMGWTPDLVSRLTTATLPAGPLKELFDTQATAAGAHEKEAGAQEKEATAAQATEKTKQIAPDAASARALQGAQAGEGQARAAEIYSKIGRRPAPGYDWTGEVPYNQADADELKNRVGAASEITANVDGILKIMGNKDFVASPLKRAQMAPLLKSQVIAIKDTAKARGLTLPDIELIDSMLGNPAKLSVMNLAGQNHNKVRLEGVKKLAQQHVETFATSHGAVKSAQSGVAPPPPAPGASPAAATHPATAKAIKWAKANPQAPEAALILKANGL
jgi:hypothetical protein